MKSVFTKKTSLCDDFVILLSSSYPSEYSISFFPELCAIVRVVTCSNPTQLCSRVKLYLFSCGDWKEVVLQVTPLLIHSLVINS